MSNYTKHFNTKVTPQTRKLIQHSEQVKNNAGGYVFEVSDAHLLERFILLGTEGGTYYVSEQTLTVENAQKIVSLIKKDSHSVLVQLKNLITRAPKKDPALFVLALICTFGDSEAKSQAYKFIHVACQTSTQLFTFCQFIQDLRGWSRGLRNGVSEFYLSKSADEIAYQMVKYRQRNGWTHKDILRLAHPSSSNYHINQLFKYAVGKIDLKEESFPVGLIRDFEHAQNTTSTKDIVKLIEDCNLTWEMIPTNMLNKPEVLKALLKSMPMTAMIRNLNRMSAAGLFDSNLSEFTKTVVTRLTNVERIKKAGLHPINILNAVNVYSRGRGDKGSLTWTPNQRIVDALEEAFELSFTTVEPTGKNLLVAVDISGSMDTASHGKLSLTAKELAAALSLTFVKSEPNVDLIWFDTQAYEPKVGKRSSYLEVIKNTPHGGGTDCSLAYQYAFHTAQKYDAVIMITDNETWAGNVHTIQLQEKYNKSVNPNCKHIVVGMAANRYSVLTDKDPNVLHVAGFDLAVPELINTFIKG